MHQQQGFLHLGSKQLISLPQKALGNSPSTRFQMAASYQVWVHELLNTLFFHYCLHFQKTRLILRLSGNQVYQAGNLKENLACKKSCKKQHYSPFYLFYQEVHTSTITCQKILEPTYLMHHNFIKAWSLNSPYFSHCQL